MTPQTIILFANTTHTLTQLLEELTDNEVKLAIVVMTDGVEYNSVRCFQIEIRHLSDYTPFGLDRMVLDHVECFVNNLFDQNPDLRETLDRGGVALSETIIYPLATLAQHWLRTALTMKNMVESINADRVLTDTYWFQMACLGGLNGVEYREGHPTSDERVVSKPVHRYLNMLAWALAGSVIKIAIPVLLGRFLNRIVLRESGVAELYLIGSQYHNKSLYPIWLRLLGKQADAIELFPFSRSTFTSKCLSERRWGIVEGLVSPRDLMRLMTRYIYVVIAYLKARIPEPINRPYLPSSSFLSAFDRFFLLNVAVAILFEHLGAKTNSSNGSRKIVFSLPNSWANAAMSIALRSSRTKIISATHGMVLDPIAYRSNNTLKITWSSFDAELLSKYSRDERYVSLGNTVNAFLQNESESRVESYDLNEHLVCIGQSKGEDTLCERYNKFGSIFPSSDIVGNTLHDFLGTSLQFFNKEISKLGIEAVIVKIHPRANLKVYERLLTVYFEHSNGRLPVYLSKTAPLDKVLKRSLFSVCSRSSIMLELLRYRVPFSVYTRGPFHDDTFINLFPDWMRYKTLEDLCRITPEHLVTFSNIAEQLIKCYWVPQCDGKEDIDKIIDIIIQL